MEMDWSAFGVELFKALLPIVIPAIVAALVAFAKRELAQAKAALAASGKPDIMNDLLWIAQTAVSAAEQAGAAGLIQDKKNYALNVVQKWMDQKGVAIDMRLVDATIESCVWNQINRDRDLRAYINVPVIPKPQGTETQ